MTIHHHHQSSSSPASSTTDNASSSPSDTLYCEEELWEEEKLIINDDGELKSTSFDGVSNAAPPFVSLEHGDLFCEEEEEELLSLFSKEEQQQIVHPNAESSGSISGGFFPSSSSSWSPLTSSLISARREAVEWILKVNSYYDFSTLTAVLSISYLDRFLSRSPQFHPHIENRDDGDYTSKPWLIQLVAVACLSLAAKVEEIHVPLLLDLQVEGTAEYVFEGETVQKMELLVLSTLDWKMNIVTPISFLNHVINRIGLKTHQHWEFHRRSERLLLSVVVDSRFVRYLPSVLATSAMMVVIDQIEPSNAFDYHNRLLGALINITKDKVKDCYDLMARISSSVSSTSNGVGFSLSRKRKPCHGCSALPSSTSSQLDGLAKKSRRRVLQDDDDEYYTTSLPAYLVLVGRVLMDAIVTLSHIKPFSVAFCLSLSRSLCLFLLRQGRI